LIRTAKLIADLRENSFGVIRKRIKMGAGSDVTCCASGKLRLRENWRLTKIHDR
jgi:hypothetical protein